ncbi:MAG TPA: hypothetical protein VFU02_02580 [Polyangiaceae bacterium]|nr:hypothetical protein [Polyangiaceae bacterium]
MLRPPPCSAFPLLILAVVSCSSSSADDADSTLSPSGGTPDGGQGSDLTSTASTGSSGSSAGAPVGSPAVSGVNLTSGGSSTTGGGGSPEVCDGLDNDGNGIADDVDVGGDGVCDCLNIATLGQIGPWSDGGNVFETWLNARSPLGATALGDEILTPELLAPFNVVVVLHVDTTSVSNGDRMSAAHHAFSDTEATAFGGWVQAGGGVMTTIGYTGDEAAEVVNVNRLLASVGMGYSTTNLDLTGHIQAWDEHPVTLGITNIFTDNGVEPAGTAGITIARGQAAEQPALQVTEAGSGRVVVWGDEWITYDSEWADVEEQQVELLWLNVLKWLSPPLTCQVPIPPQIIK